MARSAAARASAVRTPDTVSALRAFLGDRLSTAPAVREQHGSDLSYHHPAAPDAVAFAQSLDEVVRIVKICAENQTPIIPYGTGTSLEGHVQTEQIVRTYNDAHSFLAHWKRIGTHVPDASRPPLTPGAMRKLLRRFANGISVTYDVAYGVMRKA